MYDWMSGMARYQSDTREAEREIARRRALEERRGLREERRTHGGLRPALPRARAAGS